MWTIIFLIPSTSVNICPFQCNFVTLYFHVISWSEWTVVNLWLVSSPLIPAHLPPPKKTQFLSLLILHFLECLTHLFLFFLAWEWNVISSLLGSLAGSLEFSSALCSVLIFSGFSVFVVSLSSVARELFGSKFWQISGARAFWFLSRYSLLVLVHCGWGRTGTTTTT